MRLNNWSIAASYDTARIFAGLEPIPKVVESDESFVIRYAAPESSTGGCRDVET
jgi:hypothetical protein